MGPSHDVRNPALRIGWHAAGEPPRRAVLGSIGKHIPGLERTLVSRRCSARASAPRGRAPSQRTLSIDSPASLSLTICVAAPTRYVTTPLTRYPMLRLIILFAVTVTLLLATDAALRRARREAATVYTALRAKWADRRNANAGNLDR